MRRRDASRLYSHDLERLERDVRRASERRGGTIDLVVVSSRRRRRKAALARRRARRRRATRALEVGLLVALVVWTLYMAAGGPAFPR